MRAFVQAKRKAARSPKASLKYTYSAPALGTMDASSMKQKMMRRVRKPGRSHISKESATDPLLTRTDDGEMKIAEPTIVPTIRPMADTTPSSRFSCRSSEEPIYARIRIPAERNELVQ
jgi:hypothetical protein